MEHMIASEHEDARLWLAVMQDSVSEQEFKTILVTLWAIWWARRKAKHEEIFQSPLSTFNFVQNYIAELDLVPAKQKTKPIRDSVSRTVLKRWLKGPLGVAKFNVDAAVSKNANFGVSVTICRDNHGKYLGGSVLVFEGLVDPESLEAHTCCEAFSLVEDLHLTRLRIATDCLAIVRHLKSKFMGVSSTIIGEIGKRMLNFVETEVIHEAGEANSEAHDLPRASVSLPAGRYLWLSTTPDVLAVPDVIDS